MSGADLRHVESWLFDLDNTLYPFECGLSALMEPRITDYVTRVTGLGRLEAHALQKRYLTEHGLTLKGLMLHHGVDPDDYHAQFAEVSLACLEPDPELRAGLARLPGRRLVFTNADAGHAARVLARLALSDLFDDVFHIGSAAFEPKPSTVAFERIISHHGLRPAQTAFFEDAEANLRPAAQMGMTTILVGARAHVSEYVNFSAPSLGIFLRDARVKEAA